MKGLFVAVMAAMLMCAFVGISSAAADADVAPVAAPGMMSTGADSPPAPRTCEPGLPPKCCSPLDCNGGGGGGCLADLACYLEYLEEAGDDLGAGVPAPPDGGDPPDVQAPRIPNVGVGTPGYPYTGVNVAGTAWVSDHCAVHPYAPVSAAGGVRGRLSQVCTGTDDVHVTQQTVTVCLQYWDRAGKFWGGVACNQKQRDAWEGLLTGSVTGCIGGTHSYRTQGFGSVAFSNGQTFSSPVVKSASTRKSC